MKNETLYYQTIDALHKGWENENIQYNSCKACAVANIIGRGNRTDTGDWWDHLEQVRGKRAYCLHNERKALQQIERSGYSVENLILIEQAFEGQWQEDSYIDCELDVHSGLMAVIDTLDQIHENTDKEVTTSQKKRFAKV